MKVCPCLTLILGKNLLRYTWVCKLKLSTFRILNYIPWIFPLTQPELTLTGSKVGWICIQIIFTGPSLDMSVVDQGGTNSASTKFSKTILLMEIYVILVEIRASWVTQLVQITRNTIFFPGPKKSVHEVIVWSTCVSKTLSLLSELLNNWRLSDVEIQGWNWARLLEQRVPKMTQIFAWGSSMKIIKVIIMTIIVSWLAFKNLLAWICYILLGGYACRVLGILWFLCTTY